MTSALRVPWKTLIGLILVGIVIGVLSFANSYTLDADKHCAPNIWKSKWPMWIGCVMTAHEGLAAGLFGGVGALFAAGLAFYSVQQQLYQAEDLEKHRRRRKHAAVRAVFPLALVQVRQYAERTIRALNELVESCEDEKLPRQIRPENVFQPLPTETLKALADFIEYSDALDVGIVEDLVAWIQVNESRLRDLVEPRKFQVIHRAQLMARIIDAACISTAAGKVFAYARRREEQLPRTVSWDAVGETLLFDLKIMNGDYQAMLEQRKKNSELPFGVWTGN